jgi:hypothetical protein
MICLTVDVEEYNWPALRSKFAYDAGETRYSFEGNQKLLALFARKRVRATFFVTGTFAQAHPDQIKAIRAAGHEVASHGFVHHYRNNARLKVEEDVAKSKQVIEGILGEPILGFRSPQVQYSERLLRAIAAAGFTYDSSLHPAWAPGYYNRRSFSLAPFRPLKGEPLLEIPIAVFPKSRYMISWLAMRTLGAWWAIRASKQLLALGITPNLYVHSLECVPMKARGVPFYFFWRTGDGFVRTIERYIDAFPHEKFGTLSDVMKKAERSTHRQKALRTPPTST